MVIPHNFIIQLIAKYLPEAAHPYYVLKKNGLEIDFASPNGNSLKMVRLMTFRRRSSP